MAKLKGEGTRLQLGSGTPPTLTFADISPVVSIEGNEVTAEDVDRTDLLSTMKEFRPSSIPDPGEMSLTLLFDPQDTNHQALQDDAYSPTVRTWRLVYNNGTTTRPHDEFSGYIKSFKTTGIEQDSDLQAEISIKITGTITRGTTTIT